MTEALCFYGTPVTALRAGLVVAPGSSTLRLLASVATRLPFVLVPKWAMTRKQPIAVGDLIRGICCCLGIEATYDRQFEVGGPVTLDFFDLLRHAAKVLQKTPTMVTVPFFPRRLYAWYLRLLDRQAHPELVRLVVESLPHDVIVEDNPVQRHIARGATRPREIDAGGSCRVKARLPRLEFRDVLGGRNTIIAIHDFAPELPWLFYRATQATIHLAVMRGFQRRMERLANTSTEKPGDESSPA